MLDTNGSYSLRLIYSSEESGCWLAKEEMPSQSTTNFSLASRPPIYVLPSHLTEGQVRDTEKLLHDYGGNVTHEASEARIFLTSVSRKKRAAFDLRVRGVWTEEISDSTNEPPRKRLRRAQSTGKSKTVSQSTETSSISSSRASTLSPEPGQSLLQSGPDRIVVVSSLWLTACVKEKRTLPFTPFVVYAAKVVARPEGEVSPQPLRDTVTYIKANSETSHKAGSALLVGRAAVNASPRTTTAPVDQKGHPSPHQHRRRFGRPSSPTPSHPNKPPRLYRTTTSEFEGTNAKNLPEPPEWVKHNNFYACCRSTFANPPNEAFLAQLYKIKEARILTLDEIGVRAYSTSIASLSAYLYTIQSTSEILRLPGCDQKIAALWEEWVESAEDDSARYIQAVVALDEDEDLQHLKLFHEIWGVGPDTARKFYYDRGWKEMDDVIEYGWDVLNRVQQIAVKYYEEFKEKIPRPEVEQIASVIQRHARSCRGIPDQDADTDRDVVGVIVGGYRRGKADSSDVDIILSHREEEVTRELVLDVVSSLEQEGWITHTLTLNTTTSDRDQQTLPYRGEGQGHGFDSLDKALCVWQDPSFDQSKHKKNPNIHRRVDIIISTWRTVGCAVLGWSGGTTFQRDIRRWAKREKHWKFDSSGVRDRATGNVLDLESPRKPEEGDTWLDREKRLMNGLGIGWRPPEERCTG